MSKKTGNLQKPKILVVRKTEWAIDHGDIRISSFYCMGCYSKKK